MKQKTNFMKTFIILIFIFLSIFLQAQYWQRAYDKNNNTDLMSKIIETTNHHFIIAGSTTKPIDYGFGFDGYIISTNFNGDTLWTKTIGSIDIGAQNDFLNDVIEDQNKNLVFTGVAKQGLQEKKLWFEFFARLLTYKYLIVNKLLCFYFEIIDLSIILGV